MSSQSKNLNHEIYSIVKDLNTDLENYFSSESTKIILEYKDSFSNSLLHYGVLTGNINLIEFILFHKHIDINILNNNKTPPLYYAIITRNFKIFELLAVKYKANLNIVTNDKLNIFHIALLFFNEKILQLILQLRYNFIDINQMNLPFLHCYIIGYCHNINLLETFLLKFNVNSLDNLLRNFYHIILHFNISTTIFFTALKNLAFDEDHYKLLISKDKYNKIPIEYAIYNKTDMNFKVLLPIFFIYCLVLPPDEFLKININFNPPLQDIYNFIYLSIDPIIFFNDTTSKLCYDQFYIKLSINNETPYYDKSIFGSFITKIDVLNYGLILIYILKNQYQKLFDLLLTYIQENLFSSVLRIFFNKKEFELIKRLFYYLIHSNSQKFDNAYSIIYTSPILMKKVIENRDNFNLFEYISITYSKLNIF